MKLATAAVITAVLLYLRVSAVTIVLPDQTVTPPMDMNAQLAAQDGRIIEIINNTISVVCDKVDWIIENWKVLHSNSHLTNNNSYPPLLRMLYCDNGAINIISNSWHQVAPGGVFISTVSAFMGRLKCAL